MNTKKNKYGQYFTKPVIADFMVSLIQQGRDAKVLEPSCGEGVFLGSLKNAGFGNVCAYEIDKDLRIPFENVRRESFISSPTDEKYNVVIGNPPYIRWKNLESDLKNELTGNTLWQKYFNSLCDYLFIFILKSIEQLNEGGELIFICSEYWMNTTHSASLREYMCANGYISDIYHFKEAPLFDGVTASLVIFRYVRSSRRALNINLYMYDGKGCPNYNSLAERSCFTNSIIPQFKKGRRWSFATQEIQDKLDRLEEACGGLSDLFCEKVRTIGEFCDIGNGMVSGLDKAFKISNTESLTDYERTYIIRVLKAKDLEKYKYTSTSEYIMMPEGLNEEEFDRECPNFKKQLQPFYSELDARYKYGRNIPYWEFVFPRNYKLFAQETEKIFVPCKERISHKSYFRFCYADAGFYPLQDVTAIVRKSATKESIEYILAYLNTDYVFEWLKYNGIMKGAIVEFSEAPIASIPFRAIDWNNESDVMMHNEITIEMRKYLDADSQKSIEKINECFNVLIYGNDRLRGVAV